MHLKEETPPQTSSISTYLVFIRNHVPESLVIDDPDEDFGLHHFAVDTGIHRLSAVIVETCMMDIS